jgi:hypothetical protein
MSDDKGETPMERFENLAKRLFSIVKKDDERIDTVAEEIIEPPKPAADE